MAEAPESSDISEADISDIRETLQVQQQLLHALYNELEEERGASATAANEALSMILRLQVEKATLNMEASQYKRMAEEKISHAETRLAMLEEIYAQTEMETASLECQLQAYRYKLLSMGCTDVGISECQSPENVLMRRHDMHVKETAGCGKLAIRRLSSLPPNVFKDCAQKRSPTEREKSLDPIMAELSADQQSFTQSFNLLRKSGEFGSGNFERTKWDQIRRLVKQVKNISTAKGIEGETNANANGGKFCSLLSQGRTKTTADQARDIPTAVMNLLNLHIPRDGEATFDSSNCLEICDVFEVPKAEVKEFDKPSGQPKKRRDILYVESDDKLKTENFVSDPERSCEVEIPHEIDRLKKKPFSQNNKTMACDKKPRYKCLGNTNFSASSSSSSSEYRDELQKLYQRIQCLENEGNNTRRELSTSGEEELNLLKEIKQKLTSIETIMRRCKFNDSPPHDDLPSLPLQEAMLYFWM